MWLNKTLAVLVMVSALTGTLMAQELKVLMIGNSFSISVTRFLPQIVASQIAQEHKLHLTSAYIAGCVLERHWNEYQKAVANPEHRPYRVTVRDSESKQNPADTFANIPELLVREKWDIVTIQQGSPQSWNYATYQPWADKLIAEVKRLAPQAEVVIQQTWSYRSDDPRISGEKAQWSFDNQGMFERLEKAYKQLSEAYGGLRIIPTGLAVQYYRELTPEKYMMLSREELNAYQEPELPPQSGDVVGSFSWRDGKEAGTRSLVADTIHLNKAGEYLQGCVWYGILFGESPDKITYKPDFMSENEAELIRESAGRAIRDLDIENKESPQKQE